MGQAVAKLLQTAIAAVGSGDNPSHLVETPKNRAETICSLIVCHDVNRCEYVSVHAGNINALLSPFGGSPLYYAVLYNDIELVRILLRYGADVNLKDYAGNSSLMMSCIPTVTFDSNEMFHFLLESGADVNARNSDGKTALHVARHHSKVKELLERGADVNARDNNGKTSLDVHLGGWSLRLGLNSIVKELLHWGAQIEKRNENVVFRLVQDEACSMELIRRVFEGTGYADARDSMQLMQTPLHYAVRTGRAELVRVLLDCGASVGARDSYGYTPLLEAVNYDCGVEVVSELIRKGADVNAEGFAYFTPLHVAFLSDNKAVVELLLSKGADLVDPHLVLFSSSPCAPLLLKHSVLRSYASRIENVESAPRREAFLTLASLVLELPDLLDHVVESDRLVCRIRNCLTCKHCVSEIESMRSIRLSKDLTLYDVAFGGKWDISCARKVYESMSSGEFPMYSELALRKLARNVKKHLSDLSNNNSAFLHDLSRKSNFRTNQHVLIDIVKYLSDADCLNLYIAGW